MYDPKDRKRASVQEYTFKENFCQAQNALPWIVHNAEKRWMAVSGLCRTRNEVSLNQGNKPHTTLSRRSFSYTCASTTEQHKNFSFEVSRLNEQMNEVLDFLLLYVCLCRVAIGYREKNIQYHFLWWETVSLWEGTVWSWLLHPRTTATLGSGERCGPQLLQTANIRFKNFSLHREISECLVLLSWLETRCIVIVYNIRPHTSSGVITPVSLNFDSWKQNRTTIPKFPITH